MCDTVVVGNKSPKGHAVNSAGSIAAGTYEVTQAIDIEGKINNDLPTMGHYYVINGQKVPAQITEELCPDCGEDASCDITSGYSGQHCSEQSTLWRILVMQEYAGFRALSTGHRGKTGFAAGHQFIEDMTIIAHHAETMCVTKVI